MLCVEGEAKTMEIRLGKPEKTLAIGKKSEALQHFGKQTASVFLGMRHAGTGLNHMMSRIRSAIEPRLSFVSNLRRTPEK